MLMSNIWQHSKDWGEEKQAMRQEVKAEVGDGQWTRAALNIGACPAQEAKPAGQGRHRKPWQAEGDEGGRDGDGGPEGNGQSHSLNSEGMRFWTDSGRKSVVQRKGNHEVLAGEKRFSCGVGVV